MYSAALQPWLGRAPLWQRALVSYLNFGSVFDNQKAVTVRGTFLQNRDFMHVFYEEGYTDIEMEAGPYLSALYEDIYPRRYPVNEIVNLFINAPYDIGLIHYASDTPISKRQSLLSKSLSYFGVDATYATSVAVLRRILSQEAMRLRDHLRTVDSAPGTAPHANGSASAGALRESAAHDQHKTQPSQTKPD